MANKALTKELEVMRDRRQTKEEAEKLKTAELKQQEEQERMVTEQSKLLMMEKIEAREKYNRYRQLRYVSVFVFLLGTVLLTASLHGIFPIAI